MVLDCLGSSQAESEVNLFLTFSDEGFFIVAGIRWRANEI